MIINRYSFLGRTYRLDERLYVCYKAYGDNIVCLKNKNHELACKVIYHEKKDEKLEQFFKIKNKIYSVNEVKRPIEIGTWFAVYSNAERFNIYEPDDYRIESNFIQCTNIDDEYYYFDASDFEFFNPAMFDDPGQCMNITTFKIHDKDMIDHSQITIQRNYDIEGQFYNCILVPIGKEYPGDEYGISY